MENFQSVSSWLKDIGVEYSSIEEDFSNGYLLGLILYRYNSQQDFGQFSNKPSYSVSNLSKLQLSLEQFSIKFDPHRLINKEPNYAQKLLQKIHSRLHTLPQSPPKNKKSQSLTNPPMLSKEQRLSERVKKFEDFRLQQLEKIFTKEREQQEVIFNSKLKERSKRIEVLKSNKTFMQTWQNEGMQNWNKNQQKRKARILHENTVKMKLMNDKQRREKNSNEGHLNETYDGIKDFERNMIRLGIDHSGDSEKKIVRQDIAVEAAATMAKIKESKKKNVEAAKEREVRQRNSYIEQKKNEKFEMYRIASKAIGDLLIKFTESRLNFSLKSLIWVSKKKRKLSEIEKNISNYRSISEERWGVINRKRLEELESLETTAKKEMISKKMKLGQSVVENLRKAHEVHMNMCKPIANDLIIIADQAFEYISANKKIPSNLWKEWLEIFKAKDLTTRTDTQRAESGKKSEPAHNLSEPSSTEYQNYISGLASWGPIPDNFSFSDILYDIIDCAFPLNPPPPQPEGPHYLPLKLLLLGPSFSGKKTQLKKLNETFGLKFFELPKIIEDAKKVIQKKSEPEDAKKKKPVEEEAEVFVQASLEVNLEDEIGKAKLIRAKLRGVYGDAAKSEQEEVKKQGKKEEVRSQGYVIVNYPNSLQEAVDLERQFSGFVHPKELPMEEREIKKKEALVMVKPRPKDFEPVRLFNSAWDVIVVLEQDEGTAVRRAAERRVDPSGNVYNLLLNPPPDNILAKCKPIDSPSEDVIKADYAKYQENKEPLLHWFSLFGVKNNQILITIDATQHPDAVFDTIKAKAHEIMAIKASNDGGNDSEEKLKQKDALDLYRNWEELKEEYLWSIKNELSTAAKVWNELETALQRLREDFLNLIKQNDEKKQIADSLFDEFNSTIRSKSVFSKQEIEDLHERFESTSDTLWDIINSRKQSFINYRETLISSFNADEKLLPVLAVALSLCNSELQKYSKSIQLIFQYNSLTDAPTFFIPPLDTNLSINLPLENSIYLLSLKFSNQALDHSQISEESSLYLFRISSICAWAKKTIEAYRVQVSELFDIFDKWIIQSVNVENQAVSEYLNHLQSSFKARIEASVKFPQNNQLLNIIT